MPSSLNLKFVTNVADISAALDRFPVAAGTRMLPAMSELINKGEVIATTRMFQKFKHPTGDLEAAWIQTSVQDGDTHVTGLLENYSPYAKRRNYGFSGRTDSLGRYYPNDPGIGYMEYTFRKLRKYAVIRFTMGYAQAWQDVSGDA